jgi:uncharacterized protein (DUF58 family)
MDRRHFPQELISRPLELAVRRLADDLRYGQDVSPHVGAGTDYVQSRGYVFGDPVKDIDWRVTARTERVHVKQYEALKTMPVYLLVDTSASMSCTSTPLSKQHMAAILAGGLGLAALHRFSPVGLMGCGERKLNFRPSLSRNRVFQWLHELFPEKEQVPKRSPFPEATRLGARIDQLLGMARSASLVVIVSDLHDPRAVPAIKRLGQRHDSVVLHLEDPAERGRLCGGLFRAREAESGRSFVAHGLSRWFRRHVSPGHALKAAGLDYLLLGTDRPFLAPLRQFLADRGGLVRNTR